MKFNFLIFFIFLISCSVPEYNKSRVNKQLLLSSGFAYIYNEVDYQNKIINKKFNRYELEIGHSSLKAGSTIKIINPENKKFVILKNNKNVKYPEFYKILITEYVADILDLDTKNPFVEIQEIRKNKSFVAAKAKTHVEERRIHSKAPIEKVQIKSLSQKNKSKKIKSKFRFSILIGEFYSIETAENLKKKISHELRGFKAERLSIKVVEKNKIRLISGSYNSINLLKNDYMLLKNFGFEELDIVKK